MSRRSHLERAIEKKSRVASDEFKELVESRQVLLDRRSVILQRLSLLEKDSPEYRKLQKEEDSIKGELGVIKGHFKDRGLAVTNFVRCIVQEYMPRQAMSKIMDEANRRFEGHEPQWVDLTLLNESEMDIVQNRYPALQAELAQTKKKIREFQDFVRTGTPDISGDMTPEQYSERLAFIKFCSKLQALLK
jgi:hypothetical protein